MTKTLQQKNTQYLFYRLLVVLLASSVLFYFLMLMQASHMQEKQLLLKQLNVKNIFRGSPQNFPMRITGEYEMVENGPIPEKLWGKILDTSIYYEDTKKNLPFDMLTEGFEKEGKYYQLTTFVSSTEISHLIIKVFLIEACILALLFAVIIYINRKTSGSLWMPFRHSMKSLGEYDITQNKNIDLPTQTGITEFNELNAGISQLIQKVNQAYHQQKQFVENASHEIQTPLAIIRSKLELLINQPNITEETASLLAELTEANDRLSLLNKNLLLLAKIENNQFPEIKAVNFSELLHKTITIYRQHYEEGFPAVTTAIADNIIIHANLSLMEILTGNLLKNAIIHNIPSGNIDIELREGLLKITNSGAAIQVPPEYFFERFRKGNDALKSTGLGLALVKQICQLYGFRPDYHYTANTHQVNIMF